MTVSNEIYAQLLAIAGEANVLTNEPMSKHTTFRIGGPAAYFVTPANADALAATIRLCNEAALPYYILGNGSNLLVSDDGFDGVMIRLFNTMNDITVDGTTLTVGAGALLSRIAAEALRNSLTGFEFAAGIPGTLGGAVVMNAGAYGGEMKNVLVSATVMDLEGNVMTLSNEELELGYRTSIIARKGYIVLSAVISLQPGEASAIRAVMDDLATQRRTKQPLEFPSAGSTFKRPEGYFAGKLIQDAGLRGFTVGGAMVSEKHCGFVINKGDATASDVLNLIEQVKQIVLKDSGVTMEPEVKLLGF